MADALSIYPADSSQWDKWMLERRSERRLSILGGRMNSR